MTEDEHTPPPYRLHDMERATIVAGRPGGEVANCTNGFGNQDANANFIILACNSHSDMLEALRRAEEWLSGWMSAEPYIETIRAAIAKGEGRP